MGAACKKCGSAIEFKKNANGKLYPTNPDGTAHWDLCKQRTRANGRLPTKPAVITKSSHTVFYESDTVPPWDDSLGDFACSEGCCPP
jgi:hypothetical protein